MAARKISADAQQHEVAIDSGQLVSDFKALMADAEALIKATTGQEDGVIGAIRSKTLETLSSAKENLSAAQGPLTDKAKVVAESADEFVHRNPWEAVGVAAGLGLLIGLFIRRR